MRKNHSTIRQIKENGDARKIFLTKRYDPYYKLNICGLSVKIKFFAATIFTFLIVMVMTFQIVLEKFDLTTLSLVIAAIVLMAAILTLMERK